MQRPIAITLVALALVIGCTGFIGRAIKEGVGAAKGASGKVVTATATPDLIRYKGLRVEPITVAEGVPAPTDMPSMIQTNLVAAAAARGLPSDGQPALTLSGEIVHYETADALDTAIGPLAEVIVHVKLTDAQSGKVVDQGSFVGRSKATTSSSPKDLAGGVGKALDKWLKAGGLKKAGEKQ